MNNEYYTNFEQTIESTLIKYCKGKNLIDENILVVEELDELWNKIAPEYMADAVPEIADYPAVAIAWAGFIGMGVAAIWDADWQNYKEREDIYNLLQSPRGFDCMDEYILEEMLNLELESPEAKELEDALRNCAYLCEALLRKENIEAQSKEAFYSFAIIVKHIYKIGVSIILKKLGYKYHKMSYQKKKNCV
ncbi:MAG: hypothetical protein R3Y04_08225 [Rikenellaceae bacterium]